LGADSNQNPRLHIIRGAWQRLAHNDVLTQYLSKSSSRFTHHAPTFRPDSERTRLESNLNSFLSSSAHCSVSNSLQQISSESESSKVHNFRCSNPPRCLSCILRILPHFSDSPWRLLSSAAWVHACVGLVGVSLHFYPISFGLITDAQAIIQGQ
jgi:hypothetical protein